MTITQLNTARHHGLNLTDMQILLILAERGSAIMTDLADALDLTEAAITAAAKKLIAKHLIQKADRHTRDRFRDVRIVTLTLCELGRVRIHQITGTFPEPPPGADRRIDCGSGHDYGICPDCKQGHGHAVMRQSVAVPL